MQLAQSKINVGEEYPVLNVQYSNNQNRQELEQIIEEQKRIIELIIKEIHQLTTFQSHQAMQHEIIISKMQSNMHQNKNRIADLQSDIMEITTEQEKLLKQFDQEKQKVKKSIQNSHLTQINDILKKTEELEFQYKSLRELQQKEVLYKARIQFLNKQIIHTQYAHHDNMNKEEGKQVLLDGSVVENNAVSIKETKKNAAKMAKEIVIIEKNYNQQHNFQLKNKLHELQAQLSKLKKQRNQILEKRKQAKINTTINEQELQQYKAVGSLQKAKIKANKDKIQNLKRTIATQIAKRQSRLTDLKKQRQGNQKVLKLKLHRLEKQKQELRLYGQKLKILGDTIMLQREQVENFFLMAMQVTRKEIESSQVKSNVGDKHYGQKVDIEQLAPKDKQRIITNLYTKLALGPK